MRRKHTFLRLDFRHDQLFLAFGPLLIWGGSVVFGAFYWRQAWGIPLAMLMFSSGGWFLKRFPSFCYALAARNLGIRPRGLPGTHFLFFNLESLETLHKLKVIPEDAGFIYAEAGCYRITTLNHDFRIPFDKFYHEIIIKEGVAKGLLLRFQPLESEQVVECVASCMYYGNDLRTGADSGRKCAWASQVIDAMRA